MGSDLRDEKGPDRMPFCPRNEGSPNESAIAGCRRFHEPVPFQKSETSLFVAIAGML
jgi:hypothetical protein